MKYRYRRNEQPLVLRGPIAGALAASEGPSTGMVMVWVGLVGAILWAVFRRR